MGLLDGKVAVVTGAGNGIGRAHAMALAAEGAKVLVNDVGRKLVGGEGGQGLEQTPPDISVAMAVVDEITELGGVAAADATDVASVARAEEVVRAAVETFGDLDILVNNAGTLHNTDVGDVDDARLDGDFSVNVHGTAGTIKAAFEVMKEKGHGGSIINTMTGFGSFPAGHGLMGYNAAKYGVVSLTLSAAAAGVPLGIRVNAICPNAITRQSRSWFFDEGWLDRSDEDVFAHLTPDRNSPLVVFLASDAARDLTARMFYVQATTIGTDAQVLIKEGFVVETDGVVADSWTTEEIEAAMSSFLRSTDREGDWNAAIPLAQTTGQAPPLPRQVEVRR
jgi:NAD(P)-dependent dehydrogenase (short-subunit alcohol dehydrogenase family)